MSSGAALFGIGWGLAGFCPGPALAAVSLGRPMVLIFVAAMLVGMWLFAVTRHWPHASTAFGRPTAQ